VDEVVGEKQVLIDEKAAACVVDTLEKAANMADYAWKSTFYAIDVLSYDEKWLADPEGQDMFREKLEHIGEELDEFMKKAKNLNSEFSKVKRIVEKQTGPLRGTWSK
jgi:hypothetical protein